MLSAAALPSTWRPPSGERREGGAKVGGGAFVPVPLLSLVHRHPSYLCHFFYLKLATKRKLDWEREQGKGMAGKVLRKCEDRALGPGDRAHQQPQWSRGSPAGQPR